MCEKLTRAEFATLAKDRGLSSLDIGKLLVSLDDIQVLSDYKKPIYLIELSETATYEDVEYLDNACVAANLAVVIVPRSMVKVVGSVE